MADQVLLLYREDYYKDDNDPVSTFEIIVAKNRDGEIGKILLQYDTNTQLIYDHDVRIDYNHSGSIDDDSPRVQFKEILGIGFMYKF